MLDPFIHNPPANLCLVRLSAIGDITHMLPILNTLKSNWPRTRITWIIGKPEYALVRSINGVEWIVFDKSLGLSAYRQVKRQLAGRSFDLLLLMQLSLRANLIPFLACRSRFRMGFDYRRARNIHTLAINRRIRPRANEHVLDSFFGFTDALGMTRRLIWDKCYDAGDAARAREMSGDAPYFLISPCSSHSLRNWSAVRYARIADYVREKYDLRVVITGSGNATEQSMCRLIEQTSRAGVVNLADQTTLRELTALIDSSVAVLAPDSGPAHLATCCNTPVIGLFAATNPDRATPYLCRQWCVNRYPDAARIWLGRDVDALPWGKKIERRGVMDLITIDEVIAKLDELMPTLL